MGAALSSHGLDPQHRELLAEYIGHSIKTLEECAQIFRGPLGRDGDDDDEYDEGARSKRFRPDVVAYPRHLRFAQFEEVFGMLVADVDPHFEFFLDADEDDGSDSVQNLVCAHQVFCAIALVANADLHAKITFILRLYTDAVGQLSVGKTRVAIHDFLLALQLVLNLADEIPSDVVRAIEDAFGREDDSKLVSVRDVYDICFTTATISGYLHVIHALVDAFSIELQRAQSMSLALAPTPNRGPDATSAVDKAKMLSRAASSFTMPSDSLLWTLKARDYAHFWQQTHLELRSRVKCAHALREMATRKTSAVIVLESSGHAGDDAGHRAIAGLLSSTNFLRFFLSFLPQDSTQKGADRSKEIHSVERAIRKCGEASLRDVLHFCSGSDSRSTTNQYPFQCIHEDEAFFNVLLRFACGAECVGVIAETPDNTNSLLLGTFLVSTLLKWIEEDLTLFEGKERYPLRSFPSCFYAPATATRGTSMCEGFATMERRNLAGLLVPSNDTAVSKMLSAAAFPALFVQSYNVWAGVALDGNIDARTSSSPLLCSLAEAAPLLPNAEFASSESSLARVLRSMVDANANRVFIRERDRADDASEDKAPVGVVRATDLILLLLQEQHAASSRPQKTRM